MLVSVILPVYNREDSIKEAADSILRQTWTDLELLAVDDGSTDGTVAALQTIRDPRLKIIRSGKNSGACAARNAGIDAAAGGLLAFHDSDDTWHADRLEKTVRALRDSGADLVFSARTVRGLGKDGTEEKKVPVYDLNEREDKLAALLACNCVSTQTILARREVFESIRFDPDMPRFQDWDIAIAAALAGFRMYYLDESLVDCVYSAGSISGSAEKAGRAYRLLEQKYAEAYAGHREAYVDFCILAGIRMEQSGASGAEFFKKAWKRERRPAHLLRYLLAKLRLYGPLAGAAAKRGGARQAPL